MKTKWHEWTISDHRTLLQYVRMNDGGDNNRHKNNVQVPHQLSFNVCDHGLSSIKAFKIIAIKCQRPFPPTMKGFVPVIHEHLQGGVVLGDNAGGEWLQKPCLLHFPVINSTGEGMFCVIYI